jgi:mannose PTS system EIIA component
MPADCAFLSRPSADRRGSPRDAYLIFDVRFRGSRFGERERESDMIGMVLVTHGRLAAEFAAALEHVVGAQTQIAAVCIGPDDDMERRRQDILRSIAEVDSGDGVVLLTDMFGGTPSNLAISVMDRAKIEVVAGVNLPMLIKLASLRQTESLERTVLGAQEAGRKYINVASQLLSDARR